MVTSSSITNSQIIRVRDNTTVSGLIAYCNQALDPNEDPARIAKAKQFVAQAYNSMFPDPTTTFNASGTWTCPVGVTSVDVGCRGGAGSGGSSLVNIAGGGGGGGGAYSRKNAIAVTPGVGYTVTVGAGGNNSGGGDSWFNTSGTVIAKGGTKGANATLLANPGVGGAGGLASSSIGDVKFSGGNGSAGTLLVAGAGGGGAGEIIAGLDASGTTPGAGNEYGGGAGSSTGTGSAYGGGGAGGPLLTGTGQLGAPGCVELYY